MPEQIMHHVGLVQDRASRAPVIFSDGLPVTGDVPEVLRDKLEIAQDPDGYRQRMLAKTFRGRKVVTSSAAVLTPKPKKSGSRVGGRNKPVNQR